MGFAERVDCPPDGALDARIAYIGARPGRDEVSEKRGFVGASGRLLWRLSPIVRSEAYVTNVRKDFSSTNDTPTKAEIQVALPGLQAELSNVKANLLVALGADALFALTGRTSIENHRGSVLESTLLPGRKVLATWHPAACLRTYQYTYVLERDLRRAAREARYSDIRRPKRTYTLRPSVEVATNYLESLMDPISVDIETFGEDPSCIGIADRSDRAICIPFIGGGYSSYELRIIWRALDHILRTRRIIGQNIQFDTTRLERWGFEMPHLWFDTMLAHHLLWPELGGASKRSQSKREGIDALAGKHSLAFLVSIYTDEPYYKDEGGFSGDFERYWTYNCKDAATTYECYLGLKAELEQFNQYEYFQEHIMGLIRPVMAMQSRGLCVDFPVLNKTKARLQREVEYLQLSFNQHIGFQCNVRSPDDIRFLYTKLGVRPSKVTKKKGALSTDEDTLRGLAYNSPHAETFQQILEIRERRTLISNFLNLETGSDGRYKANYLIHGTDSGRLSSRSGGQGPQLQNIPKGTRRVFVAAPGCTFVYGDLARAEAHFTAYDAQEEKLIELFNDHTRDLYTEVGISILGYTIQSHDDQGDRTPESQCFKQVALACNYGMKERKFVIVCRMNGIDLNDISLRGISSPERKAKYFLEGYLDRYPGILRWQKSIIADVSRTRKLTNPLGRLRIFLGRMDDHLHRIALSWRPQSTVGGITNRAMRLLHARGYIPLIQVHDSLAIEVADEPGAIERGVRDLEQAMSCQIQIHGRNMTIPVDVQIGRSWGELRAYERKQPDSKEAS
jgi:DNA polymerase-1